MPPAGSGCEPAGIGECEPAGAVVAGFEAVAITAQQRGNLDAQAKLLVELARECVGRVLAALDEAAGEAPWPASAQRVLRKQHASLAVEQHAENAEPLAWREDDDREAQGGARDAGAAQREARELREPTR